ncbi:FecR family protein [Mangrovibacterium diazotrophicum]|uniref:FecR family protein n=1 Tax=Mangrovibacterium diazotrophicum TaxID=1261403 RepID=A0A419WAN9_9BACT|nr:FecR family protein [Mangrovibacterium diazotrophicum]RKD92540.1 FecR family protein [Mangrovibacterium diazotrophicum]
MTNVPEHIFDLIMQDFAEGLPPGKSVVLKEWLEESAENRIAWNELFDTWQAGAIAGFPANQTNEAWSKISNSANTTKTRRLNWKALSASVAVAASIAIIVGLWFALGGRNSSDAQWAKLNEMATIPSSVKLVLNSGEEVLLQDTVDHELELDGKLVHTKKGEVSYVDSAEQAKTAIPVYHELVVPRGGDYVLTLADGTVVTINSDSHLKFPVLFTGETREVWLTGEAYFEVEHNPAKPFIVHASGAATRVLGTEFNVKAYRDDSFEEVTLVNGSVEYSAGENQVRLKPGYQVHAELNSTDILKAQPVDTYMYTAWKDGTMYFDDISLEELMIRLNRWYDFDYEFKDDALKERLFTGGVKKNDDLQKIFSLIGMVNDVSFSIKDNRILMDKK